MPKLVGVFILAAVLRADAAEPAPTSINEVVPPLHAAFQNVFVKEGFTREQIHQLETRYYQEGINTEKWPFTNRAKEVFESIKNPANHNAQQVAEAVRAAGCDPKILKTITVDCAIASLKILDNKGAESSILQTNIDPTEPVLYNIASNAQSTFASLQYLNTGISMTTGSVASNSAVISSLSTAVATNAAELVGLSSAVSSMSQVTGPTVALAGALGVPVSTVSSMALAGSFLGPLLGVLAIVYAAWPDEETDPWLKVEARVSQMINEKFDADRRKRLGDRLRRYVKQFSRCSQAWVNDGLVRLHGVSLPRWIVEEAQLAKGKGGDLLLQFSKSAHNYPAPPCTAQLEAHMSLERDEWFKTPDGHMSGLFMPFANMHTQLLSMLTDHPFDDKMQWAESLTATAAEYGNYMLEHLLSAWKSQVCRTMRLRHSLKGGVNSWRYHFVVLKAVVQPHAAEDCSDKCGAESGWCNYCGGKNDGACCQQGDGGVCKTFDVPVGWHGSKYKACVHTDCIQSNTGYYGSELQSFGPRENGAPRHTDECQQLCHGVTGAVAFTLNKQGMKCTCQGQTGLTRHQEKGAFSGPTVCTKVDSSLKDLEEAYQESLNETTKVPMEEMEVCDKSPVVPDFAELEEKQSWWVKDCYRKATKVATVEYNTFYQKFARFVDMLTWKAGCGARHEVEWEETAKRNGFEIVSSAFDGGHFADCNWQREELLDQNMWVFDETRARGWTGSSRVNMEEQSKMKTSYPMPSWLRDLRSVRTCLQKTAAGRGVADPNNGVSSSIDAVMEPAAMDESRVTAPSPPANPEYEELLRQIRDGA